MAARRALVVDDSKSARAYLTRILRDYHLEVDGAESAEQAIDSLTRTRPDVIFMDHLMPGMDGFQAVQAIKGNPDTAPIPILMYTSQEGELYLGQARALGALGVLPKTPQPDDVLAILQQLQLLGEVEPARPRELADVFEAAAVVTGVHSAPAQAVAEQLAQLEPLVKGEVAALRAHLAEAVAAQDARIDASTARQLAELRTQLIAAMPAAPELPPIPEPPGNTVPWLVALAAGLAAAVLGTLLWHNQQSVGGLRAELADARADIELLTARLVPVVAASSEPDPGDVVVAVPFGEAPLAGARIERLRAVVEQAAAAGGKATVEVRHFAGRFCLAGNDAGGFTLAPEATPFIQCQLVADADDAELGNAIAESAAFTAAVAELRKAHEGVVSIDVAAGPADHVAVPYPEVTGKPARVPSAGEWNAAALRNNRVEISWHPVT